MTPQTKRIAVRAVAIGVQWIFLTIALGSLVMRSDTSFADLISPHLGAAPMFVGAFVASMLLGLTVESPRYLAPLTLLMCLCSAAFIGVLTYAPVVDGVLVRTTGLDNYVTQRVLIVTILLIMAAIPGATMGNLLGAYLNIRQEVMPHPEDLVSETEIPWWDRRDASRKHHVPD
jgi:hypothetical protein